MRVLLLPVFVAALSSLAACEPSPSSFGPGLHQMVRAPEGQLRRGSLGADSGGPEVSQVLRPQALVVRGDGSVMLAGRLAAGGVALHLQAVGDADHWVLGTKGFDFVVQDELQFSARLEFSHAITDEEVLVRLQAADTDGRLGPISEVSFLIADSVPPASLLVSLAWDAPVDLDLHVRDGNGVVVGAKNINSFDPISAPSDPDAWRQGGFLDFDSNQHCELDLRNRENLVWLEGEPPSGHYQVYAHLFSACGQASVNMVSAAHLAGELLQEGAATQYEFDSRVHPSGDEAPGLLIMEFDVPRCEASRPSCLSSLWGPQPRFGRSSRRSPMTSYSKPLGPRSLFEETMRRPQALFPWTPRLRRKPRAFKEMR